MNKRIASPIIGVLAVGLIVVGVFYLQGANELTDAQSEIVSLEGNVSALGTELADSEAEVSTLEAALETEQANSAANVAALETELDQANSATQTQLDRNLTLSEELEKVTDPRHFESLEELEAWLAQDDTDTRVRWESLPPEEKAFILQVRALRDGYLLPAWFEDFNYMDVDGAMVDHLDLEHFDGIIDFVGNLAYIGTEMYYMFPLDDTVFPFAIDSPLIPPHPLPLDEAG
jgi:hypothetical protein|tara:strand:+ start:150 stop:845 length:696 start_codon:yes stop_codon:yes gene_type:complete